jgi:hypothetical protein
MRAFINILEAASRPPVKLYEVVLYTPIETVLAPYLAEVTEEPVKQWFLTVFRNWVLKQANRLYCVGPSDADKHGYALDYAVSGIGVENYPCRCCGSCQCCFYRRL